MNAQADLNFRRAHISDPFSNVIALMTHLHLRRAGRLFEVVFCKMCMHLENIGFLPVLWGS